MHSPGNSVLATNFVIDIPTLRGVLLKLNPQLRQFPPAVKLYISWNTVQLNPYSFKPIRFLGPLRPSDSKAVRFPSAVERGLDSVGLIYGFRRLITEHRWVEL